MRFITEFESTYGGESQKMYIEKIPYWEERGQAEIGDLIVKSFGWKQHEVLSEMRHTLEIEAFPMDKWVEFKKNLYELFHKNGLILSGGVLEHMLRELESYSTRKDPM